MITLPQLVGRRIVSAEVEYRYSSFTDFLVLRFEDGTSLEVEAGIDDLESPTLTASFFYEKGKSIELPSAVD